MNMLINRSAAFRAGLCCTTILFLLFAALPLCAQAKKPKKQKEIYVPDSAVQCPFEKADVFNRLNEFNGWVNAWLEAYKKDDDFNTLLKKWIGDKKRFQLSEIEPFVYVPKASDDEPKKKSRRSRRKKEEAEPAAAEQKPADAPKYTLTLSEFRSHYKPFETLMRFSSLRADAQEATKLDEAVFLEYDKTVKKLQTVIEKLEFVRTNNGKLEDYRTIFKKEFIPTLREVANAYKKFVQADEMPFEKRKRLREANEKRRREAYIRKMKSAEEASPAKKKQEKR